MVNAYESETQALAALTGQALPAWNAELPRLDRIDRWWRWNPKPIRLKKATAEHRMLRDMGHTPWLRLVVTTLAQTLYLEGVDVPGDDDNHTRAREFWQPWDRSRMTARQIPLHQAAIAYGTAYETVRAADGPDGIRARIECWSPREAIALYDDPARDTYPQLFMRRRRLNETRESLELWDAYNIWTWIHADGAWTFADATPHNATDPNGQPVCPAIRFTNQIDLEGRTPGEVEPYIALANRLNKDNYDRMLAQHYNSWRVRTATGLDMTELSDAQREDRKAKLAQEDILAGGPDVKFGTLPETSLDNLVNARQADVEELAAGIEGRTEDAANFDLTPLWEDTDTRTVSQAVDALGKASKMLGVPQEELWDMIPGVTKTRADSWRAWKENHPDADALAVQAYASQLAPATTGGDDGLDR